jgi:ubiquitin C-terminal hydrolase
MTEYFLNQEHKDLIINGLNNSNQSGLRLAKEYYNVVYNLWNIDGQKFYEPRMFKHVLGSLNNLFKKMEASDAKDMIVFFLEQIHKEINRVKPPEINTTNFAINQYNREEMLNHFFNEFKINNKSIISDNFFIITETTQKCQNCKNHNTPNYICYNYNIQNCFIFPLEEVRKYRDSRLMNQQMNQMNQMMMGMMGMNMNMNINMNYPQINTSGKVVSLEDCFEFNQKEELMFGENRIYCNLCRQNAESLYGNKILVLPNILIMILNRGKDNIYDIDLPFKEEINLTNYVLNAKEQYIYNIYGVITHLGPSGESGHFIASCKSPIDNDNNKWYKYNDAMVSKINDFNKEVVQMKTPYILFYQRKKQ